jgi:hypothetical protein
MSVRKEITHEDSNKISCKEKLWKKKMTYIDLSQLLLD